MKFIIENEILEKFPNLRIGILIGIGINNTQYPKDINDLKEDTINFLTSNYTIKTLIENPLISAWRKTYKLIGVNTKKYKPTAENFARRILKKERFPEINPIVDLYLISECVNLLPIGGYDLDKLYNNIYLRKSPGDEIFIPIGKSDFEYTESNEVIYSDDKNVLTRKWNYRDSDITKITKNTKNFILFIEASTNQIKNKDLRKSINHLEHIMIRNLQGLFNTYFLFCSRVKELEISGYF